MNRRCCQVLCVSLLLLWSLPAAAEELSFKVEMARLHYQAGARYYEVSNYKEALVEFRKAHAMEPRPALLYNMARCHESMGQAAEALKVYKQYLAQAPKAENRATVELKIENLEKAAAAKAPPAKPAPKAKPVQEQAPAAAVGKDDASAAPTEEPRPPTWPRTAGWVAVGTGGALLVTGIVFGALVSEKSSAYDQGRDGSKTHDELSELADQGRGYEKAELGTLIAGGVLAAVGAGLVLWSYMRGGEAERPSASLAPYGSATGGGVVLSLPLPEVLP